MAEESLVPVQVFRQYPFVAGERIHIEDGPRKGDWEVIEVDDKKVTLRCPISGVQVRWARFCYFLEVRQQCWPMEQESQ